MSQSNADRVRSAYQTLDLRAVKRLFARDAEWFAEDGNPAACRNRREIVKTYRTHLDWGAQGEVVEAVDAGPQVVLGLRVRYPEDRHEHKHPHEAGHEVVMYHVLTMCNDKVVRMKDHPDRASALQAVGLQP